jgi:hypothetical protein
MSIFGYFSLSVDGWLRSILDRPFISLSLNSNREQVRPNSLEDNLPSGGADSEGTSE